jgi:hypothetical protein
MEGLHAAGLFQHEDKKGVKTAGRLGGTGHDGLAGGYGIYPVTLRPYDQKGENSDDDLK